MVKTFSEHVLDIAENFCTRVVFSSPTSVVLEPRPQMALVAISAFEHHGILAKLVLGHNDAYLLRIHNTR